MQEKKSITQLIEQQYPSLSPTARNIANYIQQHPLALVSMSVAELAEVTETSKATVSRFFRQLGYESHQDAKKAMLARRASGFPIAEVKTTNNYVEQEIHNLKQTFAGICDKQIEGLAQQILTAKRVVLIGFRNSYPVAMNFRQQLKQLRGHVYLLPQPGQTISEDIIDLDKSDLVVVLGFRRRPKILSALLETLKDKQTILFTDPSGQIYNQTVGELVVCHLGQAQAFDSYAAPLSVISAICNKAYALSGDDGQIRAAAISDLYNHMGELE